MMHIYARFWLAAAIVVDVALFPGSVPAAGLFYEGQTVHIIVGFSPGGGFDISARAIARHIRKHIPGAPSIVVENMPGAGSLIAANHLYNRAKADGLTIGYFQGNQVLQQLLRGKGIAFDARKFEWIGNPVVLTPACMLTKASGIASLDKWLTSKELLKLGAITPGDTTYDVPSILASALALPLRLVTGHKGIAEIRLAVERGDVAGLCASWESLKVVFSNSLESGDVHVVVQSGPKKSKDLPGVPLASDIAKTDDGRRLIKVGIQNLAQIGRLFAVPPATPRERLQILREAFISTMKDAEFLEETKKAKIDINPVPGEEVEKVIAELFETAPGLLAKLEGILLPKN